jgi:hypothetical protein
MFLSPQYWAVTVTVPVRSFRVMVSLSLLNSVHGLPLTVTPLIGADVRWRK